MKKNILIVSVIVLVLIVGGSIFWKATPPEPDLGVIKIGAVLPLSGPIAFMGEGTLNGLLLAEDHANADKWGKLPFRIKIIAEDGCGVPKTSIGAYQKLVATDGCKIIATILSGVSMTLKPFAEEDGVLLFANATHPELTRQGQMTLRHSMSAQQEASIIVQSLALNVPEPKAAIVVQNDDYGEAFADALETDIEKKGVKIAASIKYEKQDPHIRTIAQQVISTKPSAVVLVGVGKNLGLLVRRLREYGFQGEIFASIGFVLVPGAVEAAGEFAKGINHTEIVFDTTSAAYIALSNDYKQRFGRQPGAESLIAYNTVRLLSEAMREAGVEPLSVANYIRAMSSFKGTGEQMTIKENGDILPELQIATFNK